MKVIVGATMFVCLVYPAFGQGTECTQYLEKAHELAEKTIARIKELEKNPPASCDGMDAVIVLQFDAYDYFAKAYTECQRESLNDSRCGMVCVANALERTRRASKLTCPP